MLSKSCEKFQNKNNISAPHLEKSGPTKKHNEKPIPMGNMHLPFCEWCLDPEMEMETYLSWCGLPRPASRKIPTIPAGKVVLFVDGSETWRSPVEVGIFFHFFTRFFKSQGGDRRISAINGQHRVTIFEEFKDVEGFAAQNQPSASCPVFVFISWFLDFDLVRHVFFGTE